MRQNNIPGKLLLRQAKIFLEMKQKVLRNFSPLLTHVFRTWFVQSNKSTKRSVTLQTVLLFEQQHTS